MSRECLSQPGKQEGLKSKEESHTFSNEQNGIDASIILRVVGNLGILSPNNFARLCDQTQLRDVDLEHRSLRDDTQTGEHRRAGILLNSDNGQMEGGPEFRMRDMRLLHAQRHRPNESLKLGRLTGEILADKRDLRYHSLPGLPPGLARLQHLKHLGIGLGANLRNRHIPLARLFLSLLFDHIRKYFGARLDTTIQQIRGQRSILHLVLRLLDLLLFVRMNLLLHLNLFIASLLVEDLGLDAAQLLGLLRPDLGRASFLLPFALLVIQTPTVQLTVAIHILILWHGWAVCGL